MHYPIIPSFYFENKINRLESRDESLSNNKKIIKNKIEYAFGIILENNTRVIEKDYQTGVLNFKKAYSIFEEVIELCFNNLSKSHSNFFDWYNNTNKNIEFDEKDIFELYYLSAAIGGLIKSSQANPKELVYLPKIGKLLNKAILLDPKWSGGALQSAMMSFIASRMDMSLDIKKDSINYYFNKSIEFSDSLDASVFVTYAEILYIPEQKKQNFKNTLDYVLSIKTPKDSRFKITNIIAKKRAKWLLSNMEDYFLE